MLYRVVIDSKTTIGCQAGRSSCYVTYRLDYQIGTGPIQTFWTFREAYEGRVYQADLDISALAGQDVKFILSVLATESAAGDHVYWIGSRIYRP